MTKKDFEALAVALASVRPYDLHGLELWEDTCNAVADVCARQNLRFNREQFLDACRER